MKPVYVAIMRTPPTLTEGFNGFTNFVLHVSHISVIEKQHEGRFMELLNEYYISKAFKDKEGMFNANQGLDRLEYATIKGLSGKSNLKEYVWADFFSRWKISASGVPTEQTSLYLKKDHFQVIEKQLIKS